MYRSTSKSCAADEAATVPPYAPMITISSSTITTACSKPIPTENITSAPTAQTPNKVTGVTVTPNVQYNSSTVTWLALASGAVTLSSTVLHSTRGGEHSCRRGLRDKKDQS